MVAVTGTTSLTATGNAVTLDTATNNFTGAVSAAGTNVTLVDTNAVVLGTITDGGNLSVTAGGDILVQGEIKGNNGLNGPDVILDVGVNSSSNIQLLSKIDLSTTNVNGTRGDLTIKNAVDVTLDEAISTQSADYLVVKKLTLTDVSGNINFELPSNLINFYTSGDQFFGVNIEDNLYVTQSTSNAPIPLTVTMFGSIQGNRTRTAALLPVTPIGDDSYLFNNCAIGSTNCTAISFEIPSKLLVSNDTPALFITGLDPEDLYSVVGNESLWPISQDEEKQEQRQ